MCGCRRTRIGRSAGCPPLPEAHNDEHTSPPLVRVPDRDGETLQSRLDPRVLDRDLTTHGAILYRGFADSPASGLSELVSECGDTPLTYEDPATPRTALGGGVYTSTDYPASELIPPHHEAVYAVTWPRRLYFACVRPATHGGATTLADAGEVLADLSPSTVRRFGELGRHLSQDLSSTAGNPMADGVRLAEPRRRAGDLCPAWHLGVLDPARCLANATDPTRGDSQPFQRRRALLQSGAGTSSTIAAR